MSGRAAEPDSSWPHERREPIARRTLSNSFAQAPSRVMEKEIFQAGLGNVYVRHVNAERRRGVHDLSNQGTTSAGIEVGSAIRGGSHFCHARQSSKALKQRCGVTCEAKTQQESAGDRSFQLVRRTRCDDASMVDDRELPAKSIGLLHVVSGEQDGAAFLRS